MSKASERKRMIDMLAGYSLMSVRAFAGLLGVDIEEAERMVRDREIPSVGVGRERKIDPINAFTLLVSRETGRPLADLEALPDHELALLCRERRLATGGSWYVPENKPKGTVYVIEAVGVGRVKIGFTLEIEKRLAALQTASPVLLRVVHTWEARQKFERRLHKALAAYRVHGEWFEVEAADRARALMEEWFA